MLDVIAFIRTDYESVRHIRQKKISNGNFSTSVLQSVMVIQNYPSDQPFKKRNAEKLEFHIQRNNIH